MEELDNILKVLCLVVNDIENSEKLKEDIEKAENSNEPIKVGYVDIKDAPEDVLDDIDEDLKKNESVKNISALANFPRITVAQLFLLYTYLPGMRKPTHKFLVIGKDNMMAFLGTLNNPIPMGVLQSYVVGLANRLDSEGNPVTWVITTYEQSTVSWLNDDEMDEG